jgi:hypothetical protein
MAMDLAAALRAAPRAGGEADAIAAGGQWPSVGRIARTAAAIDAALGDTAAAGLIARNRPAHVAPSRSPVTCARLFRAAVLRPRSSGPEVCS